MIKLAPKGLCTGCGACAYICPKNCISMKENEIGVVYPEADETDCVQCGRCRKVCPVLEPSDYRHPISAYAAWSSDEKERESSASGGIAAEIYKAAVRQGCRAAGAASNEDFSVSLWIADGCADIKLFKNSKYVFSSAMDLYPQLRSLLKAGEKAVVVGLPCQIAAIRKLFNDNGNLLLIDVVCHGTTPFAYLKQHIAMLEKQAGDVAKRMSFRDPFAHTYTYTFTLYNAQDKRFYAKRTKDGDTYQFGYHRTVSYRENCYHCMFAKGDRISDITLSDYKGLGTMAPCSYDAKNVSCVLVNTAKGADFLSALIKDKCIVAEERPVMEPVQGDAQLRHPSVKSKYRIMFEKEIQCASGDFEKAIRPVLVRYNRDEHIKFVMSLPRRVLRRLFKK